MSGEPEFAEDPRAGSGAAEDARALSESAGRAVSFDFEDFGEWLAETGKRKERGALAFLGAHYSACRALGCLPEQPGPWAFARHLVRAHGWPDDGEFEPASGALVASAYARAQLRARAYGRRGVLRRGVRP